MTLTELKRYLHQEIESIYPKTEIDSFFFLLLEERLGLYRKDWIINHEMKINKDQISILKKDVTQLKKEIPIQHIFGKTEFYGFPFKVTSDTLIPRPETEELISWICESVDDKNLSILDIGTGSGCIAITLKKVIQEATVSAIDVSTKALKVAKQNAEINKVSINLIEQNILSLKELPKQFDIIVSNPPYVRNLEKQEIKNNVLNNEPHLALFVDDKNPLIFYDKIAELAYKHLSLNGMLFFEINEYLGNETLELVKSKGFKKVELKKDMFGKNRMIKACRN